MNFKMEIYVGRKRNGMGFFKNWIELELFSEKLEGFIK